MPVGRKEPSRSTVEVEFYNKTIVGLCLFVKGQILWLKSLCDLQTRSHFAT